jgi:hypothetical protein
MKSAFVGKKKSFELIKMHGKTTIKISKAMFSSSPENENCVFETSCNIFD